MKKKEDIISVEDRIVVDGRDVERAEVLSKVRDKADSRVEHTVELSDNELLTKAPGRH